MPGAGAEDSRDARAARSLHSDPGMSEPIDDRALVSRVAARIGGASASDARRAVTATLPVLAESLAPRDRDALRAALGPSLGGSLHAGPYAGAFDADELFARVTKREHVTGGFAREHAEVVLVELFAALAPELRSHLARELHPSVGALLAPPAHGEPPPHEHPAPPAFAHSLATGRQGSANPLATAAPPGAQSHSVVREDNPHADSKMSSASGLTQERLEESLATTRRS